MISGVLLVHSPKLLVTYHVALNVMLLKNYYIVKNLKDIYVIITKELAWKGDPKYLTFMEVIHSR